MVSPASTPPAIGATSTTSASDGQRFAMPHKVLQRTYSTRFNDFALESRYCGECWKDGTVAVHLGVHHRVPVHGGGVHEGGGVRRGLWRPGAPDPYLPFVRDTPPPRSLGRRLQPAAHPGGCLAVTLPIAPVQDIWGGRPVRPPLVGLGRGRHVRRHASHRRVE